MADISDIYKPKKKLYVHKPQSIGGKWVIRIVDSLSPLATSVEEISFNTFGDAFRAYPLVKKENGDFR